MESNSNQATGANSGADPNANANAPASRALRWTGHTRYIPGAENSNWLHAEVPTAEQAARLAPTSFDHLDFLEEQSTKSMLYEFENEKINTRK